MGEGRVKSIGLDLGVSTCGWGAIEIGKDEGTILGTNTYCFNAPVVGGKAQNKFDSLKAAKRAQVGAMRRTRRKRAKINALRRLLHNADLLPHAKRNALAEAQYRVSPTDRKPQITPFDLRAEALDRALNTDEFAVVVGHLFSHPGFRSSAKRLNRPNEIDERRKVLAGIQAMSGYAGKGYRTVGEMLAKDAQFRTRKRNRAGNYSQTVNRSDIEFELREIFREQLRHGNKHAQPKLLTALIELLDRKAEPKDDYYPVGPCRFENGETRAARHSFSFERFRVLSKLARLEIIRHNTRETENAGEATNEPIHPRPEELALIVENFGSQPSITYADLRKMWQLPEQAQFATIKKADEANQDIASAKGECASGTRTLRGVLGEGTWTELLETPELLDKIAHVLTFATKASVVERDLNALGLNSAICAALHEAYAKGTFDQFRGAGHISAEAARKLIPHLHSGKVYSEACQLCGYNHTAPPVMRARNTNQVTQRAVTECLLLLEEIIRSHGMPDVIGIELGRDVGRSAEKREEMEEAINKATARLKRMRANFESKFGHLPTELELLRYRLAEEQGYKSLYSGADIPREAVQDGFNAIEIDHILPRSRFGIVRDYDNLVVS